MSSALTTKVRLVSCPNCLQLLPELPDLHFYKCGKCGAIKVRELESLPLLGSHYDHSYYDNNDYDDQHYQTTFQGSVDSNPIVHPLASISPRADTDYDVLANLLPVELDIDSAGSDDFDPRVSSGGPVQAQGGAPAPPIAGKIHYSLWCCTSASDQICTQSVRRNAQTNSALCCWFLHAARSTRHLVFF